MYMISSAAQLEDFLRKGSEQLCAGYIIYGSSTMLVYTTGQGVHGFTLDPSIGEFLLSHEGIAMPPRGRIYSVNESYYNRWDVGVQRYVDYLKEENEAYDIGIEEILDSGSLKFIEWPQKINNLIDNNVHSAKISSINESKRKLEFI